MLKMDQSNYCFFRTKCFLCFTLFLIFFLSGCTLKKPYVGEMFDTRGWPKYSSGKTITVKTDAAEFKITITKSEKDGVYLLKGTMDGSRGSLKSGSHLIVEECRFSILLSKDNVVVDNVSFFPIGTDHNNKLPFKKKFKTVPFDSFHITYRFYVGG